MRQRDVARAAVVAVVDVDGREWAQAADILIARHRTGWFARRWLSVARRRYPGCVVVVSRQRAGRWCLVGLPDGVRVRLVRGRPWSAEDAVRLGRSVYGAWLGPQWNRRDR
ncbi:hypothetical protein [Actinophytocola gossypii]|uniref:Uncharacterized protein n=1 Tax=Actinophytocola gossypii TaxID=2812003 RepID=A0ABT2JHQ6_9PSEU|nr:hypothetical protein [Actinophytocola gossypii]MCT2586930.1 hypothetical protein [Actinophytocola gossypii]